MSRIEALVYVPETLSLGLLLNDIQTHMLATVSGPSLRSQLAFKRPSICVHSLSGSPCAPSRTSACRRSGLMVQSTHVNPRCYRPVRVEMNLPCDHAYKESMRDDIFDLCRSHELRYSQICGTGSKNKPLLNHQHLIINRLKARLWVSTYP
jgi:hypothetical protein